MLIAALTLAAPAHADSNDAAFLQALSNHGVLGITSTSGGSVSLIKAGHAVCTFLDSGATMKQAGSILALHHSADLSADDATFFVQTATTAYCPQYLG